VLRDSDKLNRLKGEIAKGKSDEEGGNG
jgi:hypothetical protein